MLWAVIYALLCSFETPVYHKRISQLIYSRISNFCLFCWTQLAQLILKDENWREFKDSVDSDFNKKTCLCSVELSKKWNKACSIVVVVVTLGGKQENSSEGFLSHMCPFWDLYSGPKDHTNSGVAKITCNSGTKAPSQWTCVLSEHTHNGPRHSRSLVRSLLA